MINKNKTIRFRSMVYKILEHLEGWEILDSPNVKSTSIIAANGKSAITFNKNRKMMRVTTFIHPDFNFDRKQKITQYTIRFLPGESPKRCAEEMEKRFLHKVIEQTKTLRTIDEQ